MFAQVPYSELAPFIELLRPGDRVFLTNTVTGRGLEATMTTLVPLDMDRTRPPGGVADLPRGLAGGQEAGLVWRSHEDGVGNYWTGGRPTVQWTRPGATPVATSGEHHHH